MKLAECVVLVALASACRGGSADGGGGAAGGGGEGGFPVSDATELSCPQPGTLPFVTESHGFANPDAQTTAENNPRSKDESSDTLGVPGGARIDTYADASQEATAGDPVFLGRKARTANASGLSSYPLTGEATSLWAYDPDKKAWATLGRATTDDDGHYQIAPETPPAFERTRPIYSVLEADGSCAEHYDYLMPEGTKVVVTDIDGTLTTSDDELITQIGDGSYVPEQNASADVLMNTWVDKGYVVIYLSARPHMFRSETRAWMKLKGFPVGPVITASSLVFDESARAYKAGWLSRVLDTFHWDVVAVYGNAESDIQAYEDVGIPKDVTFIVGEFAGANGTQAIQNNDYTDHIASFVESQPDVDQNP